MTRSPDSQTDSTAPPSQVDATKERSFPCAQCGAILDFAPGTRSLKCQYCGHENPIAAATTRVEEHDFSATLGELERQQETTDRAVVKCDGCGAESAKPENITALACPFCGANIVTTATSRRLIKPQAILPFVVNASQAATLFMAWLKRRWFAPSGLAKLARIEGRLAGVYLPYWTYDCGTTTRYTGQRGDNYWVTETYTETDSNGQTHVRTRQVQRTRWTYASGTVERPFDDVLVVASESLPRDRVTALEPWDLAALTPYQDEFLSGFRAESYQLSLQEGFGVARLLMEPRIRERICADIGGDHQQIDSMQTNYRDITFKHILLPVWISAYRYRQRIYRILINARTGEVQGERPWSWMKITALVAAILAVGAVIALVASRN